MVLQRALAAAVLLLALVSAGLGALLVPPGEVPDEPAHISRADSVVHGQVIGRRGPDREWLGTVLPDVGVVMNPGLHWSLPSFPAGLTPQERGLTRAAIAELQVRPWARRPSYTSAVNTAPYPPVLYLPAAAGLRLAQVSGLAPWDAMRLARLCNALAYALAGAAALLLARRAHALLAAVLLLPMSLYLAGSVNQDGPLIAAATLAAALLTRGAPWSAPWGAAALLAVVIAAKPVYLPLAGLLLLAPAGWRSRAGAAALAGLPGVAWFLAARRVASAPFVVSAPYPSGPLWPGPATSFVVTDPALQAQTLLHQPLLLLRLPLEAIIVHSPGRLREIIGVLGKLDLVLPKPLYQLWGVAIAVAVLAALLGPREATGHGPRWGWIWAAACLVACVFAVYLSQYLTWTPVGANGIVGVQGRYFIPLLPFLAVALPQVRARWGGMAGALACVPVLAAAALGAVLVPVLTAETYLLR